jgi:pimeloyl-ACP methyl ester carboxylesterase
VLAVQGCDDEYGTLEQVRGIVRRLPSTRLVELPACGHSPHKDQPARLIAEAARFIASAGRRTTGAGERTTSTQP